MLLSGHGCRVFIILLACTAEQCGARNADKRAPTPPDQAASHLWCTKPSWFKPVWPPTTTCDSIRPNHADLSDKLDTILAYLSTTTTPSPATPPPTTLPTRPTLLSPRPTMYRPRETAMPYWARGFTTAVPLDCSLLAPGAATGHYLVRPDNSDRPLAALCEMEADGGGWTVIAYRNDQLAKQLDWDVSLEKYRWGMGDMDGGEFWWGLEYVSKVAPVFRPSDDERYMGQYQLVVDLQRAGLRHTVRYDGFGVGNSDQKFFLSALSFTGDPLFEGLNKRNTFHFTTRDRDRDISSGNCASKCGAGWWYGDCQLNDASLYLTSLMFNEVTLRIRPMRR